MHEQTIPQDLDTRITSFDSLGLDTLKVADKHEAWRSNGECPGPEEIGTIQLSDEATSHLIANLGTSRPRIIIGDAEKSLIDEDDATAEHKASPSGDTLIDARSRQILRGLIEDFKNLIVQDYTLGTDKPTAFQESFLRTDLRFGLYSGTDMPHIDDDSAPKNTTDIRYLATITGPTTSFFVGTGFGPDFFDDGGALHEGAKVPDSVTQAAVTQGAVVRFLEQGDPHIAPSIENPVFRIFLSGTLRPR